MLIDGIDKGILNESIVKVPLETKITLYCNKDGFLGWIYRQNMMTYTAIPSPFPTHVNIDDKHPHKLHITVRERNAGFYSCQYVEEKDINILVTPGNLKEYSVK